MLSETEDKIKLFKINQVRNRRNKVSELLVLTPETLLTRLAHGTSQQRQASSDKRISSGLFSLFLVIIQPPKRRARNRGTLNNPLPHQRAQTNKFHLPPAPKANRQSPTSNNPQWQTSYPKPSYPTPRLFPPPPGPAVQLKNQHCAP